MKFMIVDKQPKPTKNTHSHLSANPAWSTSSLLTLYYSLAKAGGFGDQTLAAGCKHPSTPTEHTRLDPEPRERASASLAKNKDVLFCVA